MSYRTSSVATTSPETALYEGQTRTLEQLLSGIVEQDARWVLLVGPQGSGKTTILKALPARMSSDADFVVCDGFEISKPEDLMAVLRGRLSLPDPPTKFLAHGGLVEAIVASRQSHLNPLAMLVDNAHGLSRKTVELLAEVVRRTSAVGAENAGVWVVLAGEPALDALAAPRRGELPYVHCSVAPLTAAEIALHVERRIAGLNRSLWITSDVVEEIARSTGGIPGRIDALCDLIARTPSVRLNNGVSVEVVAAAADKLGWRRGASVPERARRRSRPWRRVGVFALILAAIGGGVYAYKHDPSMARTARDWVTARLLPAEPPRPATPSERAGNQRPARRETAGAVTPGARSTPAARPDGERRVTPARQTPTTPERARPAPPRVSAEQIAALMEGARAGSPEDIARLLDAGVPADARDAGGITALMHAVQQGHVEAARQLLSKGAQVNARDRGGITSTMLAVINERPDALQLLLERGADVNTSSGSGWTALTFAAWKGDPDLIRTLLRHGANRHVVDKQGWTPLDYAIANMQSASSDLEVVDGAARRSRSGRYSEVVPLLQGATPP